MTAALAECVEAVDGALLISQDTVDFVARVTDGAVVHHAEIDGDAEGRDHGAPPVYLRRHPLEEVEGEAVVGLDEVEVGAGQDEVLPLGELIDGYGISIFLFTGRQHCDGAKQNNARFFHDQYLYFCIQNGEKTEMRPKIVKIFFTERTDAFSESLRL